jgi:hypothetical protein
LSTNRFLPGANEVRDATLVPGAILMAAVAGVWLGRGSASPAFLSYIAAGVAIVASFFFWKAGVYAVFIVVLVEGYVRNYFDSPIVLLLKDAMLVAIYLRVFGERILAGRPLFDRHPANLAIAAFTAVVLVETLNPSVASPGQALVGIRAWLFYIPLLYVGGEMIRSTRHVRQFTAFILIACVPISVIAVMQYIAGPAAYQNLGAGFNGAVFTTILGPDLVSIYRPNATFSSSAHFAIFLIISTLLCIGIAITAKGVSRTLLFVFLGFLVAMNLLAGQRTYFLLLPLLSLVVLWRHSKLRHGLALVAAATVGLIALNLVASQLGGNSIFLRPLSLFGAERDTFAVHVDTYASAVWLAVTTNPLGLGTGATVLGTRYVLGTIPLFVEFSLAKVVGDLGIPGLIAYTLMLYSLIVAAVRVQRRSMQEAAYGLSAFSSGVLCVQLLIAFTGYDIAVAALLFWFFTGSLTWALTPEEKREQGAERMPVIPVVARVQVGK